MMALSVDSSPYENATFVLQGTMPLAAMMQSFPFTFTTGSSSSSD